MLSQGTPTVTDISAADQLEHVAGGLLLVWEPGRVHLLDEAVLRARSR